MPLCFRETYPSTRMIIDDEQKFSWKCQVHCDLRVKRISRLLQRTVGAIMADKRFTKEDDLPDGTALNTPPFLRYNANLTLAEETETRRIDAARVHLGI